jgi:prepilin-type processing-associated H-X9-DG protein
VLLFESNPGWNQSGGPELLTTENHQREGCNIAFCDGHVAFIQTKDINNLKWTAGP